MSLRNHFAFTASLLVQYHPLSLTQSPWRSTQRIHAGSRLYTKQSNSHRVYLHTTSPKLSTASSETHPSELPGEEKERAEQKENDGMASTSTGSECPYCHDKNIVICPVCEGRGYLGRTITCYYCRGAKEIECPLCIDDIYKLSYVRPQNPTYIENEEYDDEDVRDNPDREKINK